MEKFVAKSRAAWAVLLPTLAVIGNQTGLTEDMTGQMSSAVDAILTLLGVGCWVAHHFWPDKRVPTLKLKTTSVQEAALMVLIIMWMGFAVAPLVTGCASKNGPDQKPILTAEKCQTLVAAASQMIEKCDDYLNPDDPEDVAANRKAADCRRYAQMGAAGLMVACGYFPTEAEARAALETEAAPDQ